jgi:hypothetical protein
MATNYGDRSVPLGIFSAPPCFVFCISIRTAIARKESYTAHVTKLGLGNEETLTIAGYSSARKMLLRFSVNNFFSR